MPEKKDTRKGGIHKSYFTSVGEKTIEFFQAASEMLAFIGEAFLAFFSMFSSVQESLNSIDRVLKSDAIVRRDN